MPAKPALDRAVLRVRQALQRAVGVLRLGPVKSNGSARFVAMPTPCVEAFQRSPGAVLGLKAASLGSDGVVRRVVGRDLMIAISH